MNNGLDITEEQFMEVKAKEQNLMLFRNLVYIRKQFKEYKLHKKVQYCWLFLLSAFVGLKKFVGL